MAENPSADRDAEPCPPRVCVRENRDGAARPFLRYPAFASRATSSLGPADNPAAAAARGATRAIGT